MKRNCHLPATLSKYMLKYIYIYTLKFTVEVVLGVVLHHADAVDPISMPVLESDLWPYGAHWHPLTVSQRRHFFRCSMVFL